MKKLKLTFVLFIIAGLSGFLISNVNTFTAPKIAENAANREKGLYSELFADIVDFEKIIDPADKIENQVIIYGENKEIIGYVYKATGVNGYGSITVLTAIDTSGMIKGIKYSAFAQTPGFGDKVKEEDFINQFSEMDSNAVNVVGKAGATYSSNLVKDIVMNCASYHNENVK